MKFQNLSNLYEHMLQDMYYAETRTEKVLPELAKKADNSDLKTMLETHVTKVKDQTNRLEKVFKTTGMNKTREKCEAIEGILRENDEIVSNCEDDVTRDAAIITGAQKMKHYKIASYGTLAAMSEKLGYTDATTELKQMLDDSRNVDQELTQLANRMNVAQPVA